MDEFDLEVERANKRAEQRRKHEPHAVAAHFDRERGKIVVELSGGCEFGFAPELAQGLHQATVAELEAIEISPSGYGLHFPRLDADLWLPALMQDVFGSASWMARQMGSRGGKAKTAAKAAAARANGTRGGRPKIKRARKSRR